MSITKAGMGRVVFGRYAGAEKVRLFVKALVIVAGLDFATKLIAWAILRDGQRIVVLEDALWFKLLFNTKTSQIGPTISAELGLGATASMLPLCIASFGLASAERSVWRKFLLVAGMILIVTIVEAPLGRWLYPILGEPATDPARMFANVTFCFFLLRLARSRTIFMVLAVLTSANLCNLSNLIASPRGVIDFVHIALITGRRGVGNLADLVIMGTLVLVLPLIPLRLAIAVVRSARPQWRPRWLAWVDEPLVQSAPSAA